MTQSPNEPNAQVQKQDEGTGLSALVQSRNQRSIRDDGSFNIEQRGLPFIEPSDVYQELITMPWWKFNTLVLSSYALVNTLFAIMYYLIGIQHLTNIEGSTEWERFLDAFFFSAQSLTTVGYGRVAPVGIPASGLAALESLIGLMGFALATGLIYARFSKPKARILHSKNMIMAPYQGGAALMFRIANGRRTQLVEAEVSVTLGKIRIEDGKEIRRYYPLNLERSKISLFPMAWTIVHPINDESPLYEKTQHDFVREDIEIMVYIKAFDETFSDTVHHRISYKSDDLIWGAKFVLPYEQQADGKTIHHLNKVGEFIRVELPNARKEIAKENVSKI
ncbi:MAG: ion channel [Chitinophagales bacterium]